MLADLINLVDLRYAYLGEIQVSGTRKFEDRGKKDEAPARRDSNARLSIPLPLCQDVLRGASDQTRGPL